ncbi:siderophore-interacting protein [Streptomyces sp. LE64]|uniref:siderophore-interacting protein n=1 Tax=Streptomyces sp. LE64 TaxID=3448653 RepID=UPI004041C747
MIHAELRVTAVTDVTPGMRRITLTGEGLADFVPLAPDQQVKLFFGRDGRAPRMPEPPADRDPVTWYQRYLAIPAPERPWMRTYSVRHHRPARREIDVDFVLHGPRGGEGPAARWAYAAGPGDVIGLVGPALSNLRTAGAPDWKLFVGDETALPAIGALLEDLGPDEHALVIAEVADAGEEQPWSSPARVDAHWVHRGNVSPGRSTVLVDAVRRAVFPPGEVFAWVSGEAGAVRAVRRHLVADRGVDKRHIAFTGYWRLALAQDDGLTTEDTAEREELQRELAEERGA